MFTRRGNVDDLFQLQAPAAMRRGIHGWKALKTGHRTFSCLMHWRTLATQARSEELLQEIAWMGETSSWVVITAAGPGAREQASEHCRVFVLLLASLERHKCRSYAPTT